MKRLAVPLILCISVLACLSSTATAQVTRNVPAPYLTIQSAIAAASSGDTILVAPGTYIENINFLGKAITVQSSGGAAVTIIDGNQKSSVVTFDSGETSVTLLKGFTIRNGLGGIRISNASPTIDDNVITLNCNGAGIAINFGSPIVIRNTISNNSPAGCSGGTNGGGISIGGASSAQILNNVISGNRAASDGGGISLFAAGTPTIRGNHILNNTAGATGGGISMFNQADAQIVQNLIKGNKAFSGGGIAWLTPSGTRGPFVVSNTIADNDSNQGSGIYADGFDKDAKLANNVIVGKSGQTAVFCDNFNDLNPPILRFNNVFSSGASAYGGICADPTGTNGNLSADAKFVDPYVENFRLQPGSPAIDAGDNSDPDLQATDLEGSSRIVDGNNDTTAVVDMGAYEFAFTTATVSPSALTFAVQQLGTSSAPQTITIQNTGTVALQVSSIVVSGDFSQTNDCQTSSGIPAGSSCTIDVVYTPTARGLVNLVLSIASNATASPQTVDLSGTGKGPAINLTASNLNFLDTLFGSTSAPQSVTLTNTGDISLTIMSITASGDFAVTDNCGASVAVNASCQLTVTFSPTARGARAGSVTIASNAESNPHLITLSGNGLAGELNIWPSTVVFSGNQLVGSSSGPEYVNLANVGDVSLSVMIVASGDFAETNNCGVILAVSNSCVIDVTFTPTARGTQTGSLTIITDGPGSPHVVSLQGFGTAPVATLSASSISFGNQLVGAPSVPKSVSLRNTGDATLTISGIISSGDFTHTTTCGASLFPNTQCSISVTFTPSTTGPRTGSVTISDSAAGSPHVINLSGTGVLVSLSATSLNFGPQLVGIPGAPALTVQYGNAGSTVVNISSITVTGDFSQTNTCGASLAGGANCLISVTFTPTLLGTRTGTLTVTDDATGSPRTVLLSGTGVAPNLVLSTNNLSFGQALVGTTSPAMFVTLTNTGTGPLVLAGISITGNFSQTNNCGLGIAAGTNCAISVVFTPTAAGTLAGAISITSNAAGSPHTVNLSGTGLTALPVPGIASVNPTSALVGSAGFTLAVSGGNFFSTSVVRWNGTDLTTTFVSSSSLTAEIPATNLASLAAVEISVFTPAPGGGTSNGVPLALFATLNLPAKDLLFDPFSQRIYASLPSTAPAGGNTITPIDPFSLTIGSPVFVGSEPGKLAASDDGQFLYVGLDGSGEVRKFDLATQTPLIKFGLGSDPFFGTYFPEDIEVLPGNPNTIAVSRKRPGVSPRHGGVAIYDDGVRRTNVTPDHTGSNVIEFSQSAGLLYGYNNETTEFGFRRMIVNVSGVTVQDVTSNLISGFGPDIEFDGGRIYANNGGVIDPSIPSLTGTFALGNLGFPRSVRPVSSVGRTFFVGPASFFFPGTASVLAFDQSTLVQVGAITVPVASPFSVGSLIHWGTDGLAFRADSQVVLLRTSLLTPSAGSNPVPKLTGLTPDNISHGAGNTFVDASGSDFVPGSVVRWNGARRTTTFVSSTQLRVAIPASDLAIPATVSVTVFNPLPGGGISNALTFTITNMSNITLQPASLTFGNQIVGATSAPQTVTLSNGGSFPVPIASVATTSDFAQTNNCGNSLAAGATCTFNVTFAPTASGVQNGKLTITHYTLGIFSVTSLSGTGTAPNFSIPSNLTFGNQLAGTTSAAQIVTLTNTGTATLTIASITVTGANGSDFAKTDNCGSSVPAGMNCTLNVTFAPTTTGLRTGTLSVASNAAGSPHAVDLSGMGFDLSVSAQPGSSMSQTIPAGQPANFNLSFAPNSSLPSPVPVSLACALPSNMQAANCTITPGSVNLGPAAANFTVTVTTTQRSMLLPRIDQPPQWPLWFYVLSAALITALAAAVRLQPRAVRKHVLPALAPAAAMLVLVILLVSCGGGGGSGPPPPPPQPFTAPGTYTVAVTATAQGVPRTTNLTVVVQ